MSSYQQPKTCKRCDHDFTVYEFSLDHECPKCGGETKNTPLFKDKKEWEQLMRWQG